MMCCRLRGEAGRHVSVAVAVAMFIREQRSGLAGTVFDRVRRWRDDLLANPKMQTLAVALPFLRPVANKRARQLFDLCIGFVHTQVVTACIELDVLEILGKGPKASSEIAMQTGLGDDAAERLLNAAVAVKLVVRMGDGRYRLGELGAAVRGAPGVVEIVRHNQVFYRDLADPVALLKGEKHDTELSRYWPYAEGQKEVSTLGEADTAPYTDFMAATQPFIAEDVIAAYNFSRHRAVLDVGGGSGKFAASLAKCVPGVAVGVFDLPSVVAQAETRFQEAALGQRGHVHPGDFHRDPMPGGYDAITLIRILLDHDDARVAALLAKVRRALPPGGVLIVAELMSGVAGAETISDAYFGFYLMAMGRGRPRSVSQISALMSEAGFANVHPVSTRRTLMTQVVVGHVLDA